MFVYPKIPDDESFQMSDGQGFKYGVEETLGNEEMDKPKTVISIARKYEVTGKMAKQREQLKNFVVRHCVGGNKLK